MKKLGLLLVLFLFIINISMAYESFMPSFAIGSDDNAYITWVTYNQDPDGIYYSKHSGVDGSPLVMEPFIVSEVNGAETPWVDVDSNGDSHVVWTEYSQDGLLFMLK